MQLNIYINLYLLY